MKFNFKNIKEEDIIQIIKKHEKFKKFWGRLPDYSGNPDGINGWAPPEEAMKLLDEVWFDVQVSLSCRLREFFRDHTEDENTAKIISLWGLLGSLVENTLRFFLSVYILQVEESEYKKCLSSKKTSEVIIPKARFTEIIKFIKEEKIFNNEDCNWVEWIDEIRSLRNSVHSFNKREIYDSIKLEGYIIKYKDFLECIDDRLPWP